MPRIEPAEQRDVKESLKARALKPDVLGANFPVYTRRIYFTSEQDIVKKITVKNGQTSQVKYLFIELIGIDDIEGEIDCPGLRFTYNFHYFVGYMDAYPEGAPFENSTEEFEAGLINLRNEFSLSDKVLKDAGGNNRENVTSEPPTRENFIQVADDPLTGATGHFIDLILAVEIV